MAAAEDADAAAAETAAVFDVPEACIESPKPLSTKAFALGNSPDAKVALESSLAGIPDLILH